MTNTICNIGYACLRIQQKISGPNIVTRKILIPKGANKSKADKTLLVDLVVRQGLNEIMSNMFANNAARYNNARLYKSFSNGRHLEIMTSATYEYEDTQTGIIHNSLYGHPNSAQETNNLRPDCSS